MSSSSRNHKSEVPLQRWTHDVFLSYHDKDIGESFASDLYSALTHAGLDVCTNKHNLSNGDHKHFSAIQSSRSSIIVFSRNFDASTWFLEEMEKILECRRTVGQVFVPVFYDVNPSNVRHQKGTFAQKRWFRRNKSMRYRTALFEATSISGFCMR